MNATRDQSWWFKFCWSSVVVQTAEITISTALLPFLVEMVSDKITTDLFYIASKTSNPNVTSPNLLDYSLYS